MKKIIFLIVFIIINSLYVSVVLANEKTIHFVTDPEKKGGYLIEITKAAYEKVGYKIEIEYLPWARAITLAMEGKSEAILGAYYNEERAKKLYYSDVLATSELVFFKLKNKKLSYKKLSDLTEYKIGIIRGASYTKEFNEAAYLQKDESSDYLISIKKLLTERVDLVLEKKSLVLNALKTQFPKSYDGVDYLTPPLTELKFYNCFSKSIIGIDEKIKDFNRGLQIIKSDGTYQKILKKGLHE